MKTLLIIGGTGFFGKSILDAFGRDLLKPWGVTKIISMARNAHSLQQIAPQLVTSDVTLISADIKTTDSLPYADYVIHAAASTDVRDYISRPEHEKENIQAGVYRYGELAKKFHVKSKIVYVSSGAVYGAQSPTLGKLDELTFPCDVRCMDFGKRDYSIAKRDAELAFIQLGADGLSVSIARCFAFVGCWLPRDQHFAVGNFIEDVLRHRPITVRAEHRVYRSYMYVDDLVTWLMTIMDNASVDCDIYNVGSDDERCIDDIAIELGGLHQLETNVPKVRNQNIDRYVPSIEKAAKILGLKLNYSSVESIEKSIQLLKRKVIY